MRFSDEIMDIIESQEGDTFTAKFEALVRTCMVDLPRKQRELQELQQRIQNERKNLRIIMDGKHKLERNLKQLEHATAYACAEINRAISSIQDAE